MQNFGLLAQKLNKLMLNLVFCIVPPSRPCDQPTCRAVHFAPANYDINNNNSYDEHDDFDGVWSK